MYSYSSATLAIRAKCSLCYYYLSLPDDQPNYCHRPCCHFPSNVFFPVSPRIISGHLLGHSFTVPYRALLYGRRRATRVFSRSRGSEMNQLLAEPEEQFQGSEELGWKSRRREIEIKLVKGEEGSSRKDGKVVSCLSMRDRSSSTASSSSSLLRDSEVNGTRRRRAGGESMANYGDSKKETKFHAAHLAEDEVREVQKYVDDSWGGKKYYSKRDDLVCSTKKDDSTKEYDYLKKLAIKDKHENVDKLTNLAHQVSSRENGSLKTSRRVTRMSDVQPDDVRRTLVSDNAWKNEKAESLASRARQSRYMDHRVVSQDELRSGREIQSKVADFHDTDGHNAAYTQRGFQETTIREREELKKLEKNSAQEAHDKRNVRVLQRPALNKSKEREDKLAIEGTSFQLRTDEGKQIDRRVLEHDEARRSTGILREVSKNHNSNLEAISLFDGRRITGMESKSNFVQISVPPTKDEGIQVEMNKANQDQNEMSRFRANNTLNTTNSWSPPDTRDDPQEHSTFFNLNQVSSIRGEYSQTNEQAHLQYCEGVEFERPTTESDFSRSKNGISGLQENYNTSIESKNEMHSSKTSLQYSADAKFERNTKEFDTRSNDRRIYSFQENYRSRIQNKNETSSAKDSVLLAQEEEIQRSSLTGETSKSSSMHMASTGSFHDISKFQSTNIELDNNAGRYHIHQLQQHTNDSATKSDKSSASHASRLVNKPQKEIVDLNESEKALNIFSEIQIGECIKEGGRLLSSELGLRGPSDEMWDVQGLSSQITTNAEEPEVDFPTSEAIDLSTSIPTKETSIIRRPPKSLWSYVIDIIRMSWVLQGHSRSSTLESDKKASSDESLSSETWFSGHETDEVTAGDKIRDEEKISLLKESISVKESVELLLGERNNADNLAMIEPNSSISSSSMKKGSSAKTTSSSVEAEYTVDAKLSPGTLSSAAIVEQQLAPEADASLTSTASIVEARIRDKVKVLKPSLSHPVAMVKVGFSSSITQTTDLEQLNSSKVSEGDNSGLEISVQSSAVTMDEAFPKITEIEEVDMSVNRTPKSELVPLREKIPEVDGIKESEIKRRKFQKNKQVLREQFDEWEEAFKLENEQRKLDEFFMKEAISEARKGADTWEVPVGAVLVQNGKIIARGCNMVEELRDSTAHAEMICIREASNFLRTWRLAETTLYVTLEPCPMCAGAILQARIDTVVWGAPNRLLGADGSWVRLFPSRGDAGSSNMDPPGQMVGPVHPFHPKITIRRGVLPIECSDVMQQFFKLRRKNKKPVSPPPSCLPVANRPAKFFTKLHNIFSMFCL